jgi:ABC-type Fe3+-hydroxamate transport system substrate-binding protein
VPPRRVISLCPSITETLVEIGARDRLVAATRYCTRPKGVLRGLPRIGGTKDPDVERILELAPDLVFVNEEENRRQDVEALRSAGVAVDVSFPRRVADVPAEVRRWGALVGSEPAGEAERLAALIESGLARLRDAPSRAFRYVYWIWREPWMTVSDDTYVADLLSLAGGTNVYGSESARYPVTTPEQARRRRPEAHFFPDEPYAFREARHASEMSELFGRAARLLFVAGDDYCWHGFRTLAGLEAVQALREKLAPPVQ